MSKDFEVFGTNTKALFTLRIHRGDGMVLLGMNWKSAKPPKDFVGFAIEYKEPGGTRFFVVKNRLSFEGVLVDPNGSKRSTLLSPIQKFRWVHFPRSASLQGDFVYKVTPVFMSEDDELSYGDNQEASLELRRETYDGKLNVTFTRGFVQSQAFLDRYVKNGHGIGSLLPAKAKDGLDFKPTHPDADKALEWMGFEAREEILSLLDQAIADTTTKVRVIAYDLSEREVFVRLKKLGKRLQIIIDDSAEHAKPDSGETKAEIALRKSAGSGNVLRQHMGTLQHNKTIVIEGTKLNAVVCGSTNFTWRGLYVQNNNALFAYGKTAVEPFSKAFDDYWSNSTVASFGKTDSTDWKDLGLPGIDAWVTFSPHSPATLRLKEVAADIKTAKSSLFYSLAFLHQTPGPIRDTIDDIVKKDKVFVYGVSDQKVGGIDLLKPDGTRAGVSIAVLGKNAPAPFKPEVMGGGGVRLHHKFLVVDFGTADARVYLGSYNFSGAADGSNGENLVYIKDRRIAVSYMIEALRIFDHYHFRVALSEAKKAKKKLSLAKPPANAGEKAWWEEDYSVASKILDRKLFS